MKDYTKLRYNASYQQTYDVGLRNYMVAIYKYVSLALLITGIAAFLAIATPLSELFYDIIGGQIIGMSGLGTLMAWSPFFIGMYFSFGIGAMSVQKAQTVFWIYSACMGVSLSTVGLMYTDHSIMRTFFICSAAFGAMSVYGYSTKQDLTSMGSFFMMGLIGLIVTSIINIFIGSPALYFATSFIGVVIFMGLIAWDTQRIKSVYYAVGNSAAGQKYAIVAAFQLYLNFVNLFIYLLRFFGNRKN